MQLDLARIHFPENLEEPFDFYQEKHFKIKQFYFQRAPIPVVIQKKIKELTELHEAFTLCYPDVPIESKNPTYRATQFSKNWSEDFHLLQNIRTRFKTNLVGLLSAHDSATLLEQWFNEELNYAQIWSSVYETVDSAEVNVSQEPDPMRTLQLLRELTYKPTLANITEDRESLPIDLQNELKRLRKFVELAAK